MEHDIKDLCDELLERIKDNDSHAIDELYDLMANILYRCAYSYLKNKEDSEDVLSDTFYLICKNIKKYKGKNGFNWIYTICKNTSLNMIKSKKYEIIIDPTDECDINTYKLESKESSNKEKIGEVIKVAKEILKPKDLNIILLHVIDELKFKDIALMLKENESTVRWNYNNSINKLKDELIRREISYE